MRRDQHHKVSRRRYSRPDAPPHDESNRHKPRRRERRPPRIREQQRVRAEREAELARSRRSEELQRRNDEARQAMRSYYADLHKKQLHK